MKRLSATLAIYLGSFWTIASADVISGTVIDSATNAPISQVSVSVNTVPVVSTSTDANGTFTINTAATSLQGRTPQRQGLIWQSELGRFSWSGMSQNLSVQVRDVSGAMVLSNSNGPGRSASSLDASRLSQGIYVATAASGNHSESSTIYRLDAGSGTQNKTLFSNNAEPNSSLSKGAATSELTFSKANYATVKKTVSGSQSGLQIKMQAQAGGDISFSPPAEVYAEEQSVTITASVSGATIRYTVDGSTPTATTGTAYAGPVTIQKAVNTDMTAAFVTNGSGVTMLKAAAFKNGVQVGSVFTGIYTILIPLRYPKVTTQILGLAHMAYNVSSQNWASVYKMWTDYLGYDTVMTSKGFALIKINDQQYIELYQNTITASKFQLANFGFYVKDAEAYRQQLEKAGITVPAKCTLNGQGNLTFTTVDPDGHVDEWVQYMPGSVTSQSLGQHMPGTELFGYLECYGVAVADVAAIDAYYTKVGFDGTGKKVYLPNHNDYLEMLTYSTFNQLQVGKHEKAQLINMRGVDLLAAADILAKRDPSIAQTRSTEGGSGFPMHNCVDIYNLDLSRVRMIDLNY